MISATKRWVIVGVALVMMAVTASTLKRIMQENSSVAVAERLRDDLIDLRAGIDACLSIRDQSEVRFQALTGEAGRLRDELDSLEALDPRGVPAEAYEGYLSDVEAYNGSIPEWERQAAGLTELTARCDSLVQDHNVRVGSLQEFLVDEGIWDGEWLPERRE